MSLTRMFILGILGLAMLYVMASVIAVLVPYIAMGLAVWFGGVAIHRALNNHDQRNLK